MANSNERQTNAQKISPGEITKINKNNRKISGSINNAMDTLNMSLFGSSKKGEIDALTTTFNNIMKDEIDGINKKTDGDTTSFLTKLFSNNSKANAAMSRQLESMYDLSQSQIEDFLTESYKNRLLRQSDLHEVASQLNELSEAILITRDSIVSSDLVEGHMSRTLSFKNATTTEDSEDYTPIIEKMEEKFKLQEKIKNFIIPNTLEYGDYYGYTIPYSEIFKQFAKSKTSNTRFYESVKGKSIYDSFTEKSKRESLITEYVKENVHETLADFDQASLKSGLKSEIEGYMKNIIVSNDPIPLTFLEEGVASLQYFTEKTVIEKGGVLTESGDIKKEKNKFETVIAPSNDGGVSLSAKDDKKDNSNDFSEISDCYVKLIDPLHMIPVEIMGHAVGYYYIQEEDINPLSSVLTSTMYYDNYDGSRKEKSLVSVIANQIVKSFDKKFLEENMKFKELIVEAISYYNLNEKKIRFQYIPADFIEAFKINEDEKGRGTSILEPALFNAKLYLMLLLFKMMSIILYSNDTRINYIKQSGIDTDVANKIQEIARKKQQRQINILDMFSYTTLINKVGNGAEMYMPVGQSGEKGIETEVIAGQDVQIHTDLMEMLKNAYISATGVPGVLMNYLNEADFAKTIELANTRFVGRVASNQLDFNASITRFYQKIMRYSTTIPEALIEAFTFTFAPPKNQNNNTSADLINNFNTLADFAVALFFTEDEMNDPEMQPIIKLFRKKLAKDRLPMINIQGIEDLVKDAKIEGALKVLEKQTKPAVTPAE